MPITSMTAQNKVQTKSVGGAIQTASKDMVDFKRLSKIHEAARVAIEEEEKHRTPLTPAERHIAELFFQMGANWQKKETGA